MTAEEALGRLLGSKNYRDICPDTVRREFERQLSRRGSAADAEKAARERLHALSGAFMTPGDLKTARRCMSDFTGGDGGALTRALSLHASTRERLATYEALYARARSAIGEPRSVFDAACGVNPLALGALGFENVLGWDINGGAVRLVNDWAKEAGWSVRAQCRDVTLDLPEEEFDLALAMKLLPVLETDESGAALSLLRGVKARFILVTFPTRSLSGRGVGMEKNYSEWFEKTIGTAFAVIDRFVLGNELCYTVRKGKTI